MLMSIHLGNGMFENRRFFSKNDAGGITSEQNLAFSISRRLTVLRLVGLFFGGMLYAAALPPFNWSFLAFFALTPLIGFAACDGRRAFSGALGGWCWGIGWSLFAFRFLREIDPAVPWLMAPVISLWPAVFGALLPGLWRNLAYPADVEFSGFTGRRNYLRSGRSFWRLLFFALTAAALFVLLEWTRSRLFTWNDLGVTMWRDLPFLQLAAVTGSYGINFFVAFVNAAFFAAWRTHFRNGGGAVLCVASGVLLLIHLGGAIRILNVPEAKPNWFPALLQGDLSQRRNPTFEAAQEALEIYLELSRKASERIPRPDLIIWPESAVPVAFRAAHPVSESFRTGVARQIYISSIPMLIGAIDFSIEAGGRVRGLTNSALFFGSGGMLKHKYDKIHRVPFGEYIPFRAWLPDFLIERIDMNRDLIPGTNFNPVPLGRQVRAGVAICYEGVFGYLTREFARRGANVLVVLSNDAWYPASSEPEQHLANAVTRAVETGLPMVRCGNNGGSLVVTPCGEITQVLEVPGTEARPELRRGRGIARVGVEIAEYPAQTFYVRYGEWFIGVLALLVCAGSASAIRHCRRRKRYLLEKQNAADLPQSN